MQRNERAPTTSFADREGTLRVTQEGDDIVAIGLEGEFDMATSHVIVEHADTALDDGRDLILDLSEVTFVDSSILNAILRIHKAATARGRVAVLQLGSAAVVGRLLALTGIEQILPRAADRGQAVQTIHELTRPK